MMRWSAALAALAILMVAAVVVATEAGSRALPHETGQSPAPDCTLTAVSLNMAREGDAEKVLKDINASGRLRTADILLMQEVLHKDGQPSVAEQIAKRLGYSSTFSPAAPGVFDQGLAIVSRYPLRNVRIQRLKYCELRFHCRSRFAVSAAVETPWGGVRVWNAHLDTRVNAAERVEQLQPVIDEAAKHDGPVLIGGDFNTNEFRWLGNVVPLPGGPGHGIAIRYAMESRGFKTPFADGVVTFPLMRRHLDWIFVRGLRPLGSSVEPAPFSDHHAIWTRVAL
jgi:endonuclease/exonuclease/phosphatase family metal-dependent hydrolase